MTGGSNGGQLETLQLDGSGVNSGNGVVNIFSTDDPSIDIKILVAVAIAASLITALIL